MASCQVHFSDSSGRHGSRPLRKESPLTTLMRAVIEWEQFIIKQRGIMEIFDLYDRDRIPTGETITRGQRPPENRYHLVIHICIFNQDGQMLIQKRSIEKGLWAGMWDVSVGGAAQKGDSSWQAAQRELAEELGIVFDFSNVRPAFTFNFRYGFDDVYLIHLDPKLEDLKLQGDEVTSVMWADRATIQSMIAAGDFLPYHPSLIDLFFELRLYPDFFAKK